MTLVEKQAIRVRRLAIRVATPADLPIVHALAYRAAKALLSRRHLSEAQYAAAVEARIFEIEPELIDAGTYYVAEIDRRVAACSGWSAGGAMLPGHSSGSVDGPPVRADDATAVMRASYVDPRWARQGIATLLARTTESAATLSGYRRFEALCTPPSEALRRRLGYECVERVAAHLPGGVTVVGARMRKLMDGADGSARSVGA